MVQKTNFKGEGHVRILVQNQHMLFTAIGQII